MKNTTKGQWNVGRLITMKHVRIALSLTLCIICLFGLSRGIVQAQQGWTLASAAAPYRGKTIRALFLDRAGFVAAENMIPAFEQSTGIKVQFDITTNDKAHEQQTLDFTADRPQYDITL